jgi:hypothetical protein
MDATTVYICMALGGDRQVAAIPYLPALPMIRGCRVDTRRQMRNHTKVHRDRENPQRPSAVLAFLHATCKGAILGISVVESHRVSSARFKLRRSHIILSHLYKTLIPDHITFLDSQEIVRLPAIDLLAFFSAPIVKVPVNGKSLLLDPT